MWDYQMVAFAEQGSAASHSTVAAMAAPVMAEEKALFDALAKAASYSVDAGKLVITDKDGREILRLSAAS